MIGWRVYAGLAGLALFGALVFAVFYYQGAAHRAEGKAQIEHQQATNNAEAVKAIDHYEHTTTIIREQANAGVQAIQAAPGADTLLPDGVLSSWASGIDGMRNKPSAASSPHS
jgi:hypothetical protein